jgi:sec-independent protein translocase protein TatA
MEPGIWQILIIVAIIILFFGARKIPEVAKGIGQGITEFKNATKTKNTKDQREEGRTRVEDGPVHETTQPGEEVNTEETKQKANTE